VVSALNFRDSLRQGTVQEAAHRLIGGGIEAATRRVEERLMNEWEAGCEAGGEANGDGEMAAICLVVKRIREGAAGTTVRGVARSLETALWRVGRLHLRRSPRWRLVLRALERRLGATPLEQRIVALGDIKDIVKTIKKTSLRAAGVLMLYTAMRYTSVKGMRVGDLTLEKGGASYACVVRHTKAKALRSAQKYLIPVNDETEVLEMFATPPPHGREWSARALLLKLPTAWPGRAIGVGARDIRRGVVNHLIEQGENPGDVASWVGHTLETQASSYRVAMTGTERAFGAALERA
jgi:integrase